MPPFTSISGLISSKNLVAKSFAPLSSSIVRQQNFITTNYNNNNNNTIEHPKPIITETAILNSFPRPNLQPTLHSRILNQRKLQGISVPQVCTNCSGPHSTEFCPC